MKRVRPRSLYELPQDLNGTGDVPLHETKVGKDSCCSCFIRDPDPSHTGLVTSHFAARRAHLCRLTRDLQPQDALMQEDELGMNALLAMANLAPVRAGFL